MNVREAALSLLCEYEASGKYVNLSIGSHIADSFSKEERGQLTSLLYTAVEHKLTYDYCIAVYTEKSADKLSLRTRNILRLGLCQIFHMDKIPSYAAVNETVKLTSNRGERALVNAVLRRAEREGSLPLPAREKNEARFLSVKYSVPLGTVKRLMREARDIESLLSSYNTTPPTDLTVNTLRISVDEYLEKLSISGYSASRAPFSPITVRIEGSVNPTLLPGFSEGEFFVEDEASALCASLLSPKAGERVLDCCSAPGGKSFAMAILSGDGAKIVSRDIHESKLSLIRDGAERLGLKSISVSARDAALLPEEQEMGTFDAVLCDVPCSGLGVIAKKPDLRYKDVSAADELPALQLSILHSASEYVRAGGRLVYSTCTINKKENEEVVLRFLSENGSFTLEPISLGSLYSDEGMMTLYPHIHKTDGFFFASLRKKK